MFNIYDIDASAYVNKPEMEAICGELGVETVPPIGAAALPATIDELLTSAEGKSVLNSKVEREGLVWVFAQGRLYWSSCKINLWKRES